MRVIFMCLLLMAAAVLSQALQARETKEDCWRDFNRLTSSGPKIQIGRAQFLPTSWLRAGQSRFSQQKRDEELPEDVKQYGAAWDVVKKRYTFLNGDNRDSLYPIAKAVFGVRYGEKEISLYDGTHRAMKSLHVDSPMTPVITIADYRKMSPEKAMQRMADEGYIYAGPEEILQILNFCELENDPNVYLARLVLEKVDYDAERNRIVRGRHSAYPFVYKVRTTDHPRGVPFLELKIADELSQNGIFYKESWGKEVPASVLEKIGKILNAADWTEDDPLVIVRKRATQLSNRKLARLIKANCEYELREE